jgi:hypothetical protein
MMKPTVSATIDRLRSVKVGANALAGPDIHLREQRSALHDDCIWVNRPASKQVEWHIGRKTSVVQPHKREERPVNR